MPAALLFAGFGVNFHTRATATNITITISISIISQGEERTKKIKGFLHLDNVIKALEDKDTVEMKYKRKAADGTDEWCLTTFVALSKALIVLILASNSNKLFVFVFLMFVLPLQNPVKVPQANCQLPSFQQNKIVCLKVLFAFLPADILVCRHNPYPP